MGRFVLFVSIVVVVWSHVAFAETKAPGTQAQIALAEQALGLWVEAEYDPLPAFDQRGKTLDQKNLASLTTGLRVIQSHLGTLELWGNA